MIRCVLEELRDIDRDIDKGFSVTCVPTSKMDLQMAHSAQDFSNIRLFFKYVFKFESFSLL